MATMIYAKPSFVIDKMVLEAINLFTVSNAEGTNIYVEEDTGHESVQECVSQVKYCIDSMQGVLKITLRKQHKKGAREGGDNKTGIFTFFVNTMLVDRDADYVPTKIKNTVQKTAPQNQDRTIRDDYHDKWYLAQIEMLNQKHKYELQLAEKDREIKDLKENDKDDLSEKYLPKILELFTTKQTTQATAIRRGIGDSGEPQPSETTQRVRKALSRLSKVDSDLPGTIEVVADFAERDTEKYHATISALKAGLI